MKKLKDTVRHEIEDVLRRMPRGGVPPEGVLEMTTYYLLGLLEHVDEHPEWFVPIVELPHAHK